MSSGPTPVPPSPQGPARRKSLDNLLEPPKAEKPAAPVRMPKQRSKPLPKGWVEYDGIQFKPLPPSNRNNHGKYSALFLDDPFSTKVGISPSMVHHKWHFQDVKDAPRWGHEDNRPITRQARPNRFSVVTKELHEKQKKEKASRAMQRKKSGFFCPVTEPYQPLGELMKEREKAELIYASRGDEGDNGDAVGYRQEVEVEDSKRMARKVSSKSTGELKKRIREAHSRVLQCKAGGTYLKVMRQQRPDTCPAQFHAMFLDNDPDAAERLRGLNKAYTPSPRVSSRGGTSMTQYTDMLVTDNIQVKPPEVETPVEILSRVYQSAFEAGTPVPPLDLSKLGDGHSKNAFTPRPASDASKMPHTERGRSSTPGGGRSSSASGSHTERHHKGGVVPVPSAAAIHFPASPSPHPPMRSMKAIVNMHRKIISERENPLNQDDLQELYRLEDVVFFAKLPEADPAHQLKSQMCDFYDQTTNKGKDFMKYLNERDIEGIKSYMKKWRLLEQPTIHDPPKKTTLGLSRMRLESRRELLEEKIGVWQEAHQWYMDLLSIVRKVPNLTDAEKTIVMQVRDVIEAGKEFTRDEYYQIVQNMRFLDHRITGVQNILAHLRSALGMKATNYKEWLLDQGIPVPQIVKDELEREEKVMKTIVSTLQEDKSPTLIQRMAGTGFFERASRSQQPSMEPSIMGESPVP